MGSFLSMKWSGSLSQRISLVHVIIESVLLKENKILRPVNSEVQHLLVWRAEFCIYLGYQH